MKKTKQQVWQEVLDSTCCQANPMTDNRPCDNGTLCDKCSSEWVQAIYQRKLEELGIE